MDHIPLHRLAGAPALVPSAEKELDFAIEPIVDLASGRIVATELLARPRSGLGFERWTGATFPQISARVTRVALRRYGAMGPQSVPMHINVTALDLARPELALEVRAAMAPACARMLVLEVTEQYPLDDTASTRSTIARLRDLGVRFAVDDFGAGWSSLAQLRTLPIDLVKLDGSLIAVESRDDACLLMATAAMADALGLQVVAEGIETGEELLLADLADVDYAQGFLWGPAVSIEDLAALAGGSAPRALGDAGRGPDGSDG